MARYLFHYAQLRVNLRRNNFPVHGFSPKKYKNTLNNTKRPQTLQKDLKNENKGQIVIFGGLFVIFGVFFVYF
jgi:hypothetical protein